MFTKKYAMALSALTVTISMAFSAQAAESDPIKVGFLTVKSGALAAGGKQMEDGIRLFLDQRNNTLAGRKVDLIVADTAGQPAVTKTKTQELVEKDKVDVIIGPLAAFEALAIDDYTRKAGVPVISPSAAAEDLTQRQPNKWFVRAVGTSAQPAHAMGEYAAKDLGYKRVAIIGDDFAFGHEIAAGFQRVFEENGGQVVQKLWPPLNVADYGSYIGEIKPDVDAVYAAFAGGNGVKFLKQYNEYGLKDRTPLLGAMTTVDEGILRFMGDEAVDVVSTGWYAAALDTSANKAFVDAVQEKYGYQPGYYTVGAYGAGLMLEKALEAVSGNIQDREAFMKALRDVKVEDDPRGTIVLDELGNPVMNVYVRKVEKKDGRLVNTVLHTYPEVSQFWTYDKDEFLGQPVYSRDYTPSKAAKK